MSTRQAVILAGGRGRRLQPYTAVLPKPLVPVGDRPILEIVIDQLRVAGVTELTLAVGHLAGLIEAYFGDGARFGVQIRYSREDQPLGTAGPLSLIPRPTGPFLVMNGDLLTDIDFAALQRTHLDSGALATLAVYRKTVDITLGVLELDADDRVVDYREKPQLTYLVSTGIYCFAPEVLDHLAPGQPCDLPELILRLIAHRQCVKGYHHRGVWLDIGRPEDHERALALLDSAAEG